MRELLPAYGAVEIKLINDAILLHVRDAGDAVCRGLQVACDVG